jgi:glycosyltransferase involved in cell wall biosynthesis
VNDSPDVSIVMPSFNQMSFLAEAVESVLGQTGVTLELIVVDPGSTDGSREYLQSIKERNPDRVSLIFEPDRGQSDGVNKGMAIARGRVLGWLNSDDRLHPNTLSTAVRVLPQGPSWMFGRARVIDGKSLPSFSLVTSYKNVRSRTFSVFKLLQENFVSQMTVFWTREMWLAAGGLKIEKHLDMDYDLWLRFAKRSTPIVLTDVLADFRVHADAKGSRQAQAQLEAAFLTATEHAPSQGNLGKLALIIHRVLGARTKLIYKIMKPR